MLLQHVPPFVGPLLGWVEPGDTRRNASRSATERSSTGFTAPIATTFIRLSLVSGPATKRGPKPNGTPMTRLENLG